MDIDQHVRELLKAMSDGVYEKEHIIEELFMKLPKSDLEIMANGTDGFVEAITEMKKAKVCANANANSFRPPAQHRGGNRKKRK